MKARHERNDIEEGLAISIFPVVLREIITAYATVVPPRVATDSPLYVFNRTIRHKIPCQLTINFEQEQKGAKILICQSAQMSFLFESELSTVMADEDPENPTDVRTMNVTYDHPGAVGEWEYVTSHAQIHCISDKIPGVSSAYR